VRGPMTPITRPLMAWTVSRASLERPLALVLCPFDTQPSETQWVREALASANPATNESKTEQTDPTQED
jgi:hypothetical protein